LDKVIGPKVRTGAGSRWVAWLLTLALVIGLGGLPRSAPAGLPAGMDVFTAADLCASGGHGQPTTPASCDQCAFACCLGALVVLPEAPAIALSVRVASGTVAPPVQQAGDPAPFGRTSHRPRAPPSSLFLL